MRIEQPDSVSLAPRTLLRAFARWRRFTAAARQRTAGNGSAPMESRVVLTREIAAVKVNAGQRAGPVYRIPASSTVRLLGISAAVQGMVEVEWQNEIYAVFEEDLQARSKPSQSESADARPVWRHAG
jgi:hypothetical protein